MKTVLIVGAVLALVAPASANVLVNGDFEAGSITGWNYWYNTEAQVHNWRAQFQTSGGPAGANYARWLADDTIVDPYGDLDGARMGIYQVFDTTPGVTYTLDQVYVRSRRRGHNSELIMLLQGDRSADIVDAATEHCVVYTEGYTDILPPDPEVVLAFADNGWDEDYPNMPDGSADFLVARQGTHGVVATGTKMTLVTMTALDDSTGGVDTRYDGFVVTPEPAAVLLFGLPVLLLRRRRA